MTLCELATANYHTPPLECASFSLDSQIAGMFMVHSSQRDCVEALSRSAQFWSSYSGYLREIPQLCYVFGRWTDVDLARDVYRNATVEKISFLQHISEREKMLQATMSTWDARLSELQHVALNMGVLSQDLSLLSDSVGTRVQGTLIEIISVHTKALDEYIAMREASDIQRVSQINASISRMHEHHAKELDRIVPYLRTTLQEQLGPIFSGVQVVHDSLARFRNELQEEWINLFDQLGAIHEFLSDMQRDITTSSTAVRSLDQDVDMLHDKQLTTLAVVEEFHNTILSTTASTFSEMEKINNTAHSIGSRLESFSHRSYWSFIDDLIYRILLYICEDFFLSFRYTRFDDFVLVDPQDPDQVRYNRICEVVAKVFSSVLRILLSVAASILVFVCSSRRYLYRVFAHPSSGPSGSNASSFCIHTNRENASPPLRRTRKAVSRIPDRLCR
ncbi:hypothetical protein AX15_007941 [Amanita polypyramis BW_CC]|nr:hypothetical protein AX15_007941 [Amanita polypyramis BW_CC]